jgi:small subunit ribosomal protein S1
MTANESSPARRIRIGSQRPGSKPVHLERPEFTGAASPPAPAAAASEAKQSTTVADAQPTSADSPAAGLPVANETTGIAPPVAPPPVTPPSSPPKRKPDSKRHAPAPPPAEKVPPPNIRGPLPPDLEAELAEALAGTSLDDLMQGEGANAGAELAPESRLTGRVLSIHRDSVFVDLGGRRQGVLSLIAFGTDAESAPPPEPGELLQVTVARFNAVDGLYELVLPGAAIAVDDWSQVSEGMVVEARVTGSNTGGLECEVNHLKGFIPASQASLFRIADLSQMVDQKFACVVTEVNPERRRLVLSRRAVLEREKAESREKLLADLEVGQTREGTVRSLREFGAFVDLGGVDGLIHISQLSWDRLKHANEALEEGQKVKVKIQKIDPATGKISLAFRDLSENPWSGAAQKYPTRSRVQGVVSRITDFGAFVKLESGIEGLIHISELSHKRVWRVSDVVQEGQQVEVLVQSVDVNAQRIGLSLKALESRPEPVKKSEDELPEQEAAAPDAPPKKSKPLKGGIGASSGGEKFGLKW